MNNSKMLIITILTMIFFAICTTSFFITLDNLIYSWSYVFGELNIGLILITNDLIINKYAEELKKLNPRFVDRREFKVLDCSGYILKKWNRK